MSTRLEEIRPHFHTLDDSSNRHGLIPLLEMFLKMVNEVGGWMFECIGHSVGTVLLLLWLWL